MSGTGTASLDFGVFPGALDASVAVTGQASILGTSLVEAWIYPAATADHTHDEHLVDPPRVIAGSIVAGVGFTIYGFSMEDAPQTLDVATGNALNNTPRHHGVWSVAWAWA